MVDSNIPQIEDIVRGHLFGRFGVAGLLAIPVFLVIFYAWTHWDDVKKWPGISYAVEYLGREALPKADSLRFSVAVANLDGDNEDRDYKNLIIRLLREFGGVQVLSLDRTISVKGSVPEEQERIGHVKARDLLKETNASIVIWGTVLHYDQEAKPDLYLTAAGRQVKQSKQYTLEKGAEFRLPTALWKELSTVLRLVIATQESQFEAESGNYNSNMLEPFIESVRALLNASSDRVGWDSGSIALTRLVLADSLAAVGEQRGSDQALKEAAIIYRQSLNEYARGHNPLQWAAIQNNLGTILQSLGDRESGTALLEQASTAFREALTEYTRDRDPLQWAAIQSNLGNVLLSIGDRKSDSALLEDAVIAFREALKEYTRERAPLRWAAIQSNLGNALKILGEREAGKAQLEEAVVAHREALKERTRALVPLDWAATQSNLGNALLSLGARVNDNTLIQQAVAAFREALQEHTRDRSPLQWATTQNNLGNALRVLGERESSIARLREAVAAHRSALKELTRDKSPYDWAMAESNLGNALGAIGELVSGTAELKEAVFAYREALKEIIRDHNEFAWAVIQNNLGTALENLGERDADISQSTAAVGAYREALRVFEAVQATHHASMARNNISRAELRLSAGRNER